MPNDPDMNSKLYNMILTEDLEEFLNDEDAISIPLVNGESVSFTEKDMEEVADYLQYYYDKACEGEDDTDSDSDDEEGVIPSTAQVPEEDVFTDEEKEGEEPNDDDFKELYALLDKILKKNPGFVALTSASAIDADINKYIDVIEANDQLISELENCLQEDSEETESSDSEESADSGNSGDSGDSGDSEDDA